MTDEPSNDGDRFDRLPATEADRRVEGRPTRSGVVSWWADRYGIEPTTFEDYTFWERGAGKIWALRGNAPSPIRIEGLGLRVLHTRQEHWKPTTNAVQRFGDRASRNVIRLDPGAAAAFVRGEDRELEWDGEWGYLIATREVAGIAAPLGVGLYVYGELRSMVPKGRRREL